ncbi:MAG: hypothetical protein SAJ12_18445 [Jaaginema sp. PMC 1079.18]|nr:hypothetical protein [Jaaginema sp. PMC 1080.18]MEC4852966.1 hypothetical protein [Jaaginema sp. PMC 1079.18]MEC4868075.1 hypothetical protein [Jaaginema sp. PMC 1078.18]
MTDSAELFKKLAHQRAERDNVTPPPPDNAVKKRGRPATGKRSDPQWLGRTYYIRRETALDVEAQLLQLKRQGIEIDKSELVDGLLSAWVKWQQGEKAESLLAEIAPRQKDKN